MESCAEIDQTITTICWLPLSSLFQRMAVLVAAATGMESHFLNDPRRILETVANVAPSFLIGIPRFFEKLEEYVRASDEHETKPWRERLRFTISGSAPLARTVQEYLYSRGVLVLEAYGCSENTIPIAANRVTEHRFGSVGKPVSPNEVRIAEDGEVLVRGPGVFSGYLGNSNSNQWFTSDRFYRTGDCGRFDADGFLYLTGRKSDIIKTSTGRQISPSAIEDVYREIPYVDQIVVFGSGRKQLVALVTLNSDVLAKYLPLSDRNSSAQSLATPLISKRVADDFQAMNARLADFEQVRAVGILANALSVEGGDLTPNGKLRRTVIEAKFGDFISRLSDDLSYGDQRVLFESLQPNRN
jgi:long-chain acyl-CoA synthetase